MSDPVAVPKVTSLCVSTTEQQNGEVKEIWGAAVDDGSVWVMVRVAGNPTRAARWERLPSVPGTV